MKRMLAVLLVVVMTVAMVGCSRTKENVGDEKMVQAPYDPSTPESITESTEENTTEEAADNRSDISPEFKEMMDSYEQFFDEYIAFVENYNSEETGVLALVNYADMLAEYAQMIESMEEMDESDMTETELGYYLEVTGRIYQKLAASPALY